MAKSVTRTERIAVRVTPEQKARIQRAADLAGCSVSAYIAARLEIEAERTIYEHEVITLSPRDSELFFSTLLNPPEPNQALRRAFKLHRELLGE